VHSRVSFTPMWPGRVVTDDCRVPPTASVNLVYSTESDREQHHAASHPPVPFTGTFEHTTVTVGFF
jgi:hypothetical protein